jgi:galactokinase/mevalonate kinase-like predicted kinase
MALAGAGGGGFLYILTKKVNNRDEIQQLVDHLGMVTYSAQLSLSGVELNLN